ncbi:polysaccharide pyruvyl transferase family protein [Collinsella tanakaei]|nr:polysaccharide pyruvyl transferase family protein [Collinsella tanakaei]
MVLNGDSLKHGLYGIGGLYNYGCEAIVRGTTKILRQFNPYASICYFTPRVEDDARRIADLDIEVHQITPGHRSVPLKAVNKIAQRLCIPFDSTREDYSAVLGNTDLLVSIGGDIYTIPAHLRERAKYPYFNRLVRMGQLAHERGIPEIVIGASIGPFGEYRPAVEYYADHLRDLALILCREQRSVTYLDSIGVRDNVCLMPDPAFFVESMDTEDVWGSAEYLGINLSPLALREINGTETEGDVAQFAGLISKLMDQTGLRAMLVPHVLSPDPHDNDLDFLKKVASAMDGAHRSRTEVVEPKGFLDAKRYLRSCRMVVAARMHCAVNAICEGVPTILLSYSQKAMGMCEFVYRSDRWALPLGDATENLPARLAELEGCAETVHSDLLGRIRQIREESFGSEPFVRLATVLSSERA